MASFHDLNIASKANAGIEVAVVIPSADTNEGIPTGDVLTVLSIFSERFRKAESEGYRRIRESLKATEDKDQKISQSVYEEVALDSIAQLVSDWSYDEPCTIENVKEFLSANPHMYDLINRLAADHAVFFGNAATS
ncbi:hypothetical protein [Budvicia aquatica]|uniref:Uncharacterized protein n=1 Tax=Budvicia aquatica TaxID=82979 RepID=A0A2C6BZY8_9GAMM|nr:hypothetical protein [Budvicia aquatica]PHI29680.1 hypothetical protein CRN84_10215 [Budvicia aquatica]VFS48060.1 Uncharacterised protein [Budvicia aquatica]